MPTEIELIAMEPSVFGAQIIEGMSEANVRVHTSDDILIMLNIDEQDRASQELLVYESLLFLLEREKPTEIDAEITLDQIASTFPEYSTEIIDRYNAIS
jgi:hypothetical protein